MADGRGDGGLVSRFRLDRSGIVVLAGGAGHLVRRRTMRLFVRLDGCRTESSASCSRRSAISGSMFPAQATTQRGFVFREIAEAADDVGVGHGGSPLGQVLRSGPEIGPFPSIFRRSKDPEDAAVRQRKERFPPAQVAVLIPVATPREHQDHAFDRFHTLEARRRQRSSQEFDLPQVRPRQGFVRRLVARRRRQAGGRVVVVSTSPALRRRAAVVVVVVVATPRRRRRKTSRGLGFRRQATGQRPSHEHRVVEG
mmetsp:Transcript_5512/g.14179  ORF Transcript_5512/g.14179 Transcript_5512/m.14179 type:complete len:254 (-) Transcript_5512:190-951(-)